MGKSGPRRARVWKASLRPCRQCWPTCLCGPLCSQPFHAPHCRNSGKSWSLVVISDHTREDSLVPGTSQEQALWREAFSPTSTPATPGSPGTPAEAGPAWLTPHRGKDPPSSKTKSHFLPGLSSTNALCSIQAEKKASHWQPRVGPSPSGLSFPISPPCSPAPAWIGLYFMGCPPRPPLGLPCLLAGLCEPLSQTRTLPPRSLWQRQDPEEKPPTGWGRLRR